MLEKWTNTSSPCSREMKPKPFSALKNFTVPVAICTVSSLMVSSDGVPMPTQACPGTAPTPPFGSWPTHADRIGERCRYGCTHVQPGGEPLRRAHAREQRPNDPPAEPHLRRGSPPERDAGVLHGGAPSCCDLRRRPGWWCDRARLRR